MSTIDNIAAKLTKVEIQYLINNPDKLANIWNDLQVPKKQLECEIGDCFVEFCDSSIQLYRITADIGNNIEFDAIDVRIASAEINQYDDFLSKEIAYEHFIPIDAEIFSKVEKICDELDTQVNYMYKGAVVMIKKLCNESTTSEETN